MIEDDRAAPGAERAADLRALPPGVLTVRMGAGANCSSAGSAVDLLFYTSVVAGAVFVALSAAFPARIDREAPDPDRSAPGDEKEGPDEP